LPAELDVAAAATLTCAADLLEDAAAEDSSAAPVAASAAAARLDVVNALRLEVVYLSALECSDLLLDEYLRREVALYLDLDLDLDLTRLVWRTADAAREEEYLLSDEAASLPLELLNLLRLVTLDLLLLSLLLLLRLLDSDLESAREEVRDRARDAWRARERDLERARRSEWLRCLLLA